MSQIAYNHVWAQELDSDDLDILEFEREYNSQSSPASVESVKAEPKAVPVAVPITTKQPKPQQPVWAPVPIQQEAPVAPKDPSLEQPERLVERRGLVTQGEPDVTGVQCLLGIISLVCVGMALQ